MAKCFSQKHEIDYLENFIFVVKMNIVKVILAIAVTRGWRLDQLHVKNTFLNGDIEDEVYIYLPPGISKQGNVVS